MTRNVVLVCLDSVREDYFREFAERLIDRGDRRYTQCRAASGWSVPSHASMFTGDLPHEHGIHVYNQDFSGLARSETFLGDLPEHYAFGVSANPYATSTYGFDGIFDDFDDISPHRRFPDGMDVMEFGRTRDAAGTRKYLEFLRRAAGHPHPLQSLGNGVFKQLDDLLEKAPVPKPFDDGASIVCRTLGSRVETAPEPFFAFANLMEAHGPHHPIRGFDRDLYSAGATWTSDDYGSHDVNVADDLEPWRDDLRKTRELYGASIEYLDRRVSRLIDVIGRRTDHPTSIIVTADHGENLGFQADRRYVAHKGSLTEGLLHVPMVVIDAPRGVASTVDEYVSHCSLPDLVVGLAEETVPDIATDHPCAERLGSNLPRRIDRDSDVGRYWDRAIRVCYDADRKYQWNSLGGSQAYELDRSRPNWQTPIDATVPVEDLDTRYFSTPIGKLPDAPSTEPELSTSTVDRLERLGYR